MNKKAPVFFISHGAPTFAIEPDDLSDELARLGQSLSGVKAVLVVSPHWQSRDFCVMTNSQPPTIHDFSGFPKSLYQIQYPAKGSAEFAQEAVRLLSAQGLKVQVDAERGLDHGAWVPLLYLWPKADMPVFQVSMPVNLNAQSALALGQVLGTLRTQGVLILGSGGLTHNLYEIAPKNSAPESYVKEFATWMRQAVLARDLDKLANYRQLAPHAARAHPTDEHLLPLMVAIGATDEDELPQVLEASIYYGMLAMESYIWGMRP